MIRVTVPRPVAEALMPVKCANPYCDKGMTRRDDGRGIGYCSTCYGSGSLPPVLRLLVVEGEIEFEPWRHFPAAIVRAIEAGERIGIDVDCETCAGSGAVRSGYPDYDALDCPRDCADGRVPVGSVRPVRVLPITDDDNDDCPGVPHLFVQSEAPFDDGHQVFGCGYSPCDVSESLAVYGPAESLLGKFAVEVEDARRGE